MTATVHRIDSATVASERKAQALVRTATAAYRSQIQDAACLSDLLRGRLPGLLDTLSDEVPGDTAFDDAINNLKRGYTP